MLDKKVHQRVDDTVIRMISEASGVPSHIVERNGLDEGRNSGKEMARILSPSR